MTSEAFVKSTLLKTKKEQLKQRLLSEENTDLKIIKNTTHISPHYY